MSGMGDTFDTKKGETLRVGGYFRAEKDMQHYAWTSAPTVIQIHGRGPFVITYVNPADDPRNNRPRRRSRRRSAPRAAKTQGLLWPDLRQARSFRLSCPHLLQASTPCRRKTWMAGTSPAMTMVKRLR